MARTKAAKASAPTKDKKGGSKLKRRPPTLAELEEELELTLPDEKSEVAQSLEEFNWLIYGPKGIGKTSLGSRFLDSFTLACEPGGKALSSYQRPCPNWMHFRKYGDLLTESDGKFKTLVIDTVQNAYNMCMDWTCQKNGFDHPGDEGYGKGWKKVSSEFEKQMIKAMSNNMGMVALAHDKDEEVETKSGRKFMKMKPQMTGQCESYFAGPIDIVGYYHYDGAERFLQIRGTDYVEAKCRPEDNFLTTSGEPVFKIPMGNTPDEAYENIVKAFNNEQEDSYAPEGLSVTKRKSTKPTKTKTKSKKPTTKKSLKKKTK